MQNLDESIKDIGVVVVAKACGVTERAVYKWLANGFLPKTEFFGKTKYAETIESISNGKYSANILLDVSKKNLLLGKSKAA